MSLRYKQLIDPINNIWKWVEATESKSMAPVKHGRVGSPVKAKAVFHPNMCVQIPGHHPMSTESIRTTEYTGVCFNTCVAAGSKPWRAQIQVNGKNKNLGSYFTDREAALAYDREAIKLGRKTNILKPLKK